MKRKEILLILAFLLAAGILFGIARLTGNVENADVVVTQDGEEVLRRPLALNGSYSFDQEDGSHNVVKVEGGFAWMEEANCRDHLCMHQGKIHNRAGTIVCLPHRIAVTIEGHTGTNAEDEVDIVIY